MGTTLGRHLPRGFVVVALLAGLIGSCGGSVNEASAAAGICSPPPRSEAACEIVGTVCPRAASLGCVCGPDRKWTCTSGSVGSAVACAPGSFGMPCDPGSGNPCEGACVASDQPSAPQLLCVPATLGVLSGLGLSSYDGVDCAPVGVPGSDCAHSCQGGSCTDRPATAGAACAPRDGATVCAGACDGSGSCGAVANGCGKVGPTTCSFTACSPIDSPLGCHYFPAAQGLPCMSTDVCYSNATCDAQGDCQGGTRIAGCTEPSVDGATGR